MSRAPLPGRRRVRLWPAGLTGRVTLVLLAAILIEFLGNILVFGEAERLLIRSKQAERIAEQLVVADRVLSRTPVPLRSGVAADLSTHHVSLSWAHTPGLIDAPGTLTRTARNALRDWETGLGARTLRLRFVRQDGDRRLIGALALGDGSWVRFRSNEPVERWGTARETLLRLAIVSVAVMLIAAFLVRTLGAPLRVLVDVAGQIGFAHRVIEVEQRGPRELRRLAAALNAMQERIRQLLETRTQALIAVSHDLRTPLARLTMRLHDKRACDRAAMLDDVAEMEAMLASLLDFMRGVEDSEATRRINLASLIQTEVEKAEDMGRAVTYDGPMRLDIDAHPVALRRALVNLIENALKYGGGAEVTLGAEGGDAVLSVRDRGPGMLPEDLIHAAEPFFRADAARARDTKGLGLGLAIVKQVADLHGASLSLENARGGGLRATLRLPQAQTQAQPQTEGGAAMH